MKMKLNNVIAPICSLVFIQDNIEVKEECFIFM